MSEDINQEREKWDQYYASLPVLEEDEITHAFNREFATVITDFLPGGSKVLEAGCGGGWQSLALARTGKYQINLLDFSEQALAYSRKIFSREGFDPHTLQGDVFTHGTPDYDLVFNAGALEHYSLQQQADFLRGMASRSRNYVLVLVPNTQCYWYWVWRMQTAASGNWSYGNEVPLHDLSQAFSVAGLRLIGQRYMGVTWAESFIDHLEGVDKEMKAHLLGIHRSPVIPLAQKSYLLAALGSVADSSPRSLRGWSASEHMESMDLQEVKAFAADALALRVGGEARIRQIEIKMLDRENQFAAREWQTAQENERKEQDLRQVIQGLHVILEARQQEINGLTEKLNQIIADRCEETAVLNQKRLEAEQEIISLKNSLDVVRSELQGIYVSKAWKTTQRLRRIRLALAPPGSLRVNFLKGCANLLWLPVRFLKALLHLPGRLLDHLFPAMNWETFAFDAFKRQRRTIFGGDLSDLSCPSQTGLVSIVLPVYNGAPLLREALDSILNQTYAHFELIAIDDGSKDKSGEILDEYARRDDRIQVIHQENRKLPRTLSRGFQLARGKFLTWTSHDNRLKPNFLERMVEELKRKPGWEMAYANLDIIGEDGKPLTFSDWYLNYQIPPHSEHIYLPVDPSELNVTPNNYMGAAFMYRDRTAWLLGEYSAIRFTTEDYDYWMRLNDFLTLRHTSFKEPVYDYRFHTKSLTHRDKELGITSGRVKLMAFEDFRRDFALTPLNWFIETSALDGRGERQVKELRRKIEVAGHLLLDRTQFKPDELPRLWFPAVYLYVTTEPAEAKPPADLPQGTLCACLSLGTQLLPEEMDAGWDLCLALGKPANLPHLDGIHRGWLAAPKVKTLLAALDIRVRSDHLRQIETEINQPQTSGVMLSVILCTYRRGELLASCLDALARQTLPLVDYEVVVVNNEPADVQVRQLMEQARHTAFSVQPANLRLVTCPAAGLSHARNAGIAAARGEVLCFIDDDALAHEDWLELILRAFTEHPEAGVIGGHIYLKPPEPRPAALIPGWESYWSHLVTQYKNYTEVEACQDFPWGANWCARRQALLEIGGFRTHYGRRKKDFGGGEEVVAALQIQQIGYKIAILPQAGVSHVVVSDRYTFNHVKNTVCAWYRVHYRMQKALYIPRVDFVGRTWKLIKDNWRERRVSRHDPDKALLLSYHTAGLRGLLVEQIKDAFRRRRKSLGTQP